MTNRTHQRFIDSNKWYMTHCWKDKGCKHWKTEESGDFYCKHPYMRNLGYYNDALIGKQVKAECDKKSLFENID